MRLSKFTPSPCAVEGGVFGDMYFYHSIFHRHGQCAVWLKLFNPSINACNLGAKTRRRDAHIIDTECWCCALAVVFLAEVGRGSGWGWCALVCFACFAALFACLVCCFVLAFGCLPLLGSFIFWLKAPCFGSFVVPAEGTALPLGLGDLNNLFLLVGLGLFILSRNTVSNPFALE